MGEPLIQIPTTADLPSDMRPQTNRQPALKPRLLKVRAEDIPRLLLWKALVLPVTVPRETDSGLQLAPDAIRHMNAYKGMGVVLALGPLAYSQQRGFPEGHEGAKVGDWVTFHPDAGIPSLMRGEDGDMVSVKYIADSELEAVPRTPEAHMVLL